VQWRPQLRQYLASDNAIQLTQYQPLGATGCARERTEPVGHKAVGLNLAISGWTGTEDNRIPVFIQT
jgi:hypothetical protein